MFPIVGAIVLAILEGAGSAASSLSTVVTADMLKGVMDEVISLLPVIVPVTISFIAIRKGLSFLFSSLRKA